MLLVVADDELDGYAAHYSTTLDRPMVVEGPRRTFPLRAGRVEIVPDAAFDEVLPGEELPRLPFIAARSVAVADAELARKLVEDNGIATRPLPNGFLVGAADAFDAAIVFKEDA